MSVTGIEHGNTRGGVSCSVKEEALGGEVLFHRLVIVEVVACEVGEDCHIESDLGDASLVESVTGDFHHQFTCASGDTVGHQFKQVARFGGGVCGRPHL